LKQTRHVGVAKSEHPKLTNGEIIFEKFQPMWSQFTNVTDRQTDRQTTCYRYTTLCTKVHHAVKTARLTATSPMSCYLSLVDSGSSGSHNKHLSFRKLDFWHVERLWRLARVKWSPLPWLLCLYRHPAIGESPRERERERERERVVS